MIIRMKMITNNISQPPNNQSRQIVWATETFVSKMLAIFLVAIKMIVIIAINK